MQYASKMIFDSSRLCENFGLAVNVKYTMW